MLDRFQERAFGYEVGVRRDFHFRGRAEAIDNNANAVYATDPASRDSAFQASMAEQHASIDASDLPPDRKAALHDELRNKMSYAGVQADLRDRPEIVQPSLLKGVTEGVSAGIPDSYFASLKGAESGGRNIGSESSSAFGPYQFTTGTWKATIGAHPELGLTEADRYKPAAQETAIRAFTADNAKILTKAGLPVNAATLHKMHLLGSAGGPRFVAALIKDLTADARQYVGADQAAANPGIFNGRSVAGVFALFDKKFTHSCTVVASTGTPSYYADIPIAKRDAYYAQAEQEINKRRVSGEAAFKQSVDNAIAQAASTGASTSYPSETEFVAAMGVGRGTVAYGEFKANFAASTATYEVQRLPLAEMTQYAEQFRPVAGDPFYAEKQKGYATVQTAADAIKKTVADDFGQHVVNINPDARAAIADDPARYASIVDAEAARIGVRNPDSLPKAQTHAIAAMLEQKIKAPDQTAAAVDSLNAMKDRWEENWPRIYGELKPSLSPLAQVLTSDIPKQTAVLLASVHDKSFDDLSKVMLKADKQSLTDTLQTAFQDLAKTEWGGQTDVPAFYGQAEMWIGVSE